MKTCPLCDAAYPDYQSNCDKDGALLIESRDFEPGTVIRGKYRVMRLLGRGGMGTVYLAEHILLGQHRALKFISSELSQDARFLKRFRHEAQAAIKLRHPNVAEVVDLDQAEDGSPYIAMEYVEGPDLRHALAAGAFPVERALAIARGIAQGLGAAHAEGIVHRDVKPENILLADGDGTPETPKLLDFGIAAIQESATTVSRTHGLLLTQPYAAPEQWQGMASDQLDGRADLYALGGVLYEMLTGQTPFRANNTEGWMHQHLYEEPQPPSRLRPELANWQGLDALPLRLLAKNREQRPKDAAELVSLLDAVRCVSPGARRETVVERLKSIATKKLRGKDVRRVPRWLRTPLVAVMALAIFIAGLAFGLPASTISKRADILDKAHHNNLGGILRNLACTRGDWGSCDKLAYMYFEGAGVAQNYSHAAALYSRGRALLRKACDTGDAVGCHNLSNMYEEGGPFVAKDITRAAALYSREAVILSKACEAGDASACYEAGGMYDLGYLIAKDYPRAADFYSKACKAGSAEGCDKLGFMYEVGEGVAEDDSRANDLYAKACNSGDASGCTALAIRYQYGDGMRKNVPRARELWSKACSMGQEYACAEEAKLQ